MAKKTPDERYWQLRKEGQVKREYEEWRTSERRENNPHSADLFAIEKTGDGSFRYMGFKKRDLIKLLAGILPPYYD